LTKLGKLAAIFAFIMATEQFYERFFEGAQRKLPLETAAESPFRRFNVSCFKCGSMQLKIIFEADSSGVRSASLFCPKCEQREKLPV
jgi:hypothetical protein